MTNGFEKALKDIPLASEFKRVGSYNHWKHIVISIGKEYEINEATMLSAINIRVADKVSEHFCFVSLCSSRIPFLFRNLGLLSSNLNNW